MIRRGNRHTGRCDNKGSLNSWRCNIRRKESATASNFSRTGDITDASTGIKLLFYPEHIHICPIVPRDSLVRFIGEGPRNSNDDRCNKHDFDRLPRGSLGRIVENGDNGHFFSRDNKIGRAHV